MKILKVEYQGRDYSGASLVCVTSTKLMLLARSVTPSVTDRLQPWPDFFCFFVDSFVDSIARGVYNCVVALLVIRQNESMTAEWRVTLT